ncbi:MAG: HNH endonuclease signature motif containing protein, partial [Acidimicrobiales bacterium]
GMWFGKMTLDPVSGEIVSTTLRLIERELFEADWAAARERLGREPTILHLDRTPAQRRADALVEMATRARTVPAGGRRPAPLFSVLVGYETFAGPLLELVNRTVITPGAAARWLTEADVERIIFETRSRVVDVGVQRRFFRGALKHAIEVRDRTCFHPSCDEAPLIPEIDHIQPAAAGGPTTQANGRLGCAFHNRWRNHHPDHEWDQGSPDIGDADAGPDPPDGSA